MAFVDQFTKIPFVNKSDPEYIPGTSPAISAENLNAIQDGIVDSLEAADGIDARVADVEDVFEGTLGVKCEILNTSVTIQTTDWQEDAANVRYTATITNAAITEETDVEIVLADADKGNYALNALNPDNGSVTLFVGTPPKVPLVLQVIVYEVKNIPLASAAGGGLTPSPPH